MKQLILYFLFFVGAAFIFIQCAKFFPSDAKSPKNQVKSKKKQTTAKTSLFSEGYELIKPEFKTGILPAYLNEHAFPLNVVDYLKSCSLPNTYHFGFYTNANIRPFFYNHYIDYTYNQLFGKKNGALQADNSLGINN